MADHLPSRSCSTQQVLLFDLPPSKQVLAISSTSRGCALLPAAGPHPRQACHPRRPHALQHPAQERQHQAMVRGCPHAIARACSPPRLRLLLPPCRVQCAAHPGTLEHSRRSQLLAPPPRSALHAAGAARAARAPPLYCWCDTPTPPCCSLFAAKIADFGLCSALSPGVTHVSNVRSGT